MISSNSIIYVDVDDTLIQTTLTMDAFSQHPIKSCHPAKGRWQDIDFVMEHYNWPIDVPLYAGAAEFVNRFRKQIQVVSAAPDIGVSRANRQHAVDPLGVSIKFFDDDASKLKFLKTHVKSGDYVIDDKESIISGLDTGVCILVNTDLNPGGVNWKTILEML